jgi:putative Mg2+ transporter-C (MgtC) family protein
MLSGDPRFFSLIQLFFIAKALFAFLLGGLIGWERERTGKEAGIRTFAIIAVCSCVFCTVGFSVPLLDPSRMVSWVILGTGFLGGGLIYLAKIKGKIPSGITTAASLWVTVSIGALVAFELYITAVGATLVTLFSLYLPTSKLGKMLTQKKRAVSKDVP